MYQDTSTGFLVANHVAHKGSGGRIWSMTQNPRNAIIHLGHNFGTVDLWSPNVKECLVKKLCHRGAVRSIAVDLMGQYQIV